MDDRGQVFTLEGVLAALIVLAGFTFALQAVVLTPSTSGTTTAPVESAQLDSVLTEAAASGQLANALLFWDDGGNGFVGSGRFRYYTGARFDTRAGSGDEPEFLRALNRSIGKTEAMNVILRYRKPDESIATQRMVDQGAPGQGAVRASTTVVIYDDDLLRDTSGPTGTTVKDAASTSSRVFYAPDGSPETDLFNVVEVEVVVWQR